MDETYQFRFDTGSVAILDALGFKGIWRENPLSVLTGLKLVRDKADEYCRSRLESLDIQDEMQQELSELILPRLELGIRFFSDTVLVFARERYPHQLDELDFVKEEDGKVRQFINGLTVDLCAQVCSYIWICGIAMEPALLFRGALTFGEFWVDDEFVVGPAIDEVASLMNEPQAAMIWCSRAASESYATIQELWKMVDDFRLKGYPNMPSRNARLEVLLPNYPVPLRSGDKLCSTVVNIAPFIGEDFDQVIRKVNEFMCSEQVDIRIKRQNTLKFLFDVMRDFDSSGSDE